MSSNLVLAVGNRMMGDDAAGPLLAERLKREPLAHWDVLDGGAAPENILYRVREMRPQQVLVVDSADMDLQPGEVRFLQPEGLGDPFLLTTHTLPLSYLVQSLREFIPRVDLLGIQPNLVAFGFPVSEQVRQAVDQVYESLKQGQPDWPTLQTDAQIVDGKSL